MSNTKFEIKENGRTKVVNNSRKTEKYIVFLLAFLKIWFTVIILIN